MRLLPSLVHESHHQQSPFHMKASIVNVWGENIETVLNCQEPMKTSITILESGVAGRVWYAAKHKDFSYFGESTPRNVPFFLRLQYTDNKAIENRITTLAEFLSRENGIIRSQKRVLFPLNRDAKIGRVRFPRAFHSQAHFFLFISL